MAKVKVHIKSLPIRPAGGGMYKAHSVQVLEAVYGRSLVAAGLAIMFEDPVVSSVPVTDEGTNNDEGGHHPVTIDGSTPIEEIGGDGKGIGDIGDLGGGF